MTYLPSSTTGAYAHTTTQDLVQSHKPYGSIVGYVVDGLFQTQDEVDASGQPNARLGGLKYKDLTHDGKITSDDQTWIYDPVPAFSYGLNIALNYKNFDLTMFWQGVADQDVYNNQKFQTDFWAITDPGSNKGSRLLGAWNTNNIGSSIPRLSTMNRADEGRASSYFVENGSYLKLRTLQMGYRLPASLLSKLHMTSARVYVSGQNLLTIKSRLSHLPRPREPRLELSSFVFYLIRFASRFLKQQYIFLQKASSHEKDIYYRFGSHDDHESDQAQRFPRLYTYCCGE